MPAHSKAVAFDVDSDSLASLRRGLPEWQIEAVAGVTTRALTHDWDPGTVDLLIVGARPEVAETLGLCRGLRSQTGRASIPLLVLVVSDQEALVRAALAAGASNCLVLPIHAKDIARLLDRALQGNSPGRHTLNLDRAQEEDIWRDDGGEG